ncbi:MAG: aminopeptidase P family protein [Acidobacteria bacterium]|nr:aminopeptidase P family protein [Acidobacteriota bacterium]
MDITNIQDALRQRELDGWLFYSFRGSDPIATNVLGLHEGHATRRWFYYIPAKGEATRIVHSIEREALDSLPGVKKVYLPWEQLHGHVRETLAGAGRVAMQYSPMNAIPYISRVDAGTVELIRSFGTEVVSSADLVQQFEAVMRPEQLQSHLDAAVAMRQIVDTTYAEVARRIRDGVPTVEREIQDFMMGLYSKANLVTDHPPIVAVGPNSAMPHYSPPELGSAPLRRGELLLTDLWAKLDKPHAVYFDITWTCFMDDHVPDEHARVFEVVSGGRDAGISFVQQRVAAGETVFGWEVDNATRASISAEGFGDYFIHRTGHNIHEMVHGNGANIDNLETRDERRLVPNTCFSIEPGVYLPGKFGIRSEVDVYLTETEAIVSGQPIQSHLIPVLAEF